MKFVTFDYDSTYYPSAPFIEIEVAGYNKDLGTRTLAVVGRDLLNHLVVTLDGLAGETKIINDG